MRVVGQRAGDNDYGWEVELKVRVEVESLDADYPQAVLCMVGLRLWVEEDDGTVIAEGEPDTMLSEGDEYELEFEV